MEGTGVFGHAAEDKSGRWCHPEDADAAAKNTRVSSR
jgi:hypothetical protein